MCRGPLCAETNRQYARPPGPVGYTDADGDSQLTGPTPLGMRPRAGRHARPKLVADAGPIKTKATKPEVVAKLRKPSADVLKKLDDAIQDVKKLNQTATKDETLRRKKEKVAIDVRAAFNIGKQDVSGFEFDNRANPNNYAETRETFIILFDDILVSPGFMANIILHETSHAQRNAELKAKTGRESKDLGVTDAEIFSLLKEFEATQLELDSADMTGITQKEKDEARSLNAQHLKNIGSLLGDTVRDKIKAGGLDEVREGFYKRVQSRK